MTRTKSQRPANRLLKRAKTLARGSIAGTTARKSNIGKTQPAETKRGDIVRAILENILSGKYQSGQRLVANQLASEFSVSQTPIREAISILAGMGVVQVKPNCGAIVRKFKPREVREICQVRRALECEAIKSACGRIDIKRLQHLRNVFERLSKLNGTIRARDIHDVKESDSLLHDSIREATRNRFLASELERLMIVQRALRDAAWNRLLDSDHPDLRFVIEESKQHLAIVEALLTNNPGNARRALSRHLTSGTRYTVHALEE